MRASRTAMRVLLVTWYFPPYNDVGALRTGALAQYLANGGHEVQVLTAARAAADGSLSIPIAFDRITRTSWFDVDTWSFQPRGNARDPNSRVAQGKAHYSKIKSALGLHYRNLVRLPDRQIGWLPYLLQAGGSVLENGRFDLIFASGPPFTTFLGARALARRFSLPWFAEYRDAWSDDVYGTRPAWRRSVDRMMENQTLSSARGIVAVSQRWAEHFGKRFGKPAVAIYNGFDEFMVSSRTGRSASMPLRITYSGVLYEGKRDPSCLYQAIKLAGLTPEEVEVSYYGPAPEDVLPLAGKFGVADFVRVCDRVPHSQSLAIQRESDVLLLLQPGIDEANVPAKFFEYLAARRPILGLGLDSGVPAEIIRDRRAGLYVTEPAKVAAQLRLWVDQKQQEGQIPDLPESVGAGLSRSDQFASLMTFLKSALSDSEATLER